MKGKITRNAALLGLLLLALTALPGCVEALEEEPTSFIGPDNFFRNEADARAALTGAYNQIGQGSFGGYISSFQFIRLTEKPTAEVTGDPAEDEHEFDRWRWGPASSERGVFPLAWDGAYRGINAANAVITNVPDVDMDSQLKARFIAEARFLRSLHYYYLVGFWGGVPLVEQQTEGLSGLQRPRASEAEIYEFLINDLNQAIADLPLRSQAEPGRVTKGAAQTLLAKVYLQRGSLNADNGVPGERQIAQSGDFQSAADLAQEVINSGEYSLPGNIVEQYSDMFLSEVSGSNNPEVIFAIQTDPAVGIASSLPCLFASDTAGPPMVGASWNSLGSSSLPFYLSFEDADLRKQATFLNEYPSEVTGEVVAWNNGQPFPPDETQADDYFEDAPMINKYTASAEGEQCEDDNDFILLRFADVLLIKAEALNEANQGPTGEAYAAINQVRERAELEPLSGLSYQEFREAVYTERRKELVLEGHGWHTLQRFFGIATRRVREAAEFNAQFSERFFGPVLDQLQIDDPTDRLLPIPTSIMARNPELMQNPGY